MADITGSANIIPAKFKSIILGPTQTCQAEYKQYYKHGLNENYRYRWSQVLWVVVLTKLTYSRRLVG